LKLTKQELRRQIRKFLYNPDRGISHRMFAELCGVNMDHMRDVFLYQTKPMTEMMQIRVNRGFDAVKRGAVRTMKRRDNSHFVDYRPEPKPEFVPKYGVRFVNGRVVMNVGMVNRHDYSESDLLGDE